MTAHGERARRVTSAATPWEDGFSAFVHERSGSLLRAAYLFSGGDLALAEDLLQQALTKAYLAWDRLDDPAAREAWVRRILATTATSWWRRRWHGERASAELPERPAEDTESRFLEQEAMWQVVRRLPPRQRAVLVLRYYEDLSEAETARTLGVSPGTVKSHLSRALSTVRAELERTGR